MTRSEAERRVIAAARDVCACINRSCDKRDDPCFVGNFQELWDALASLDAIPADDGWRPIDKAPAAMRVLVGSTYLSARGAAMLCIKRKWKWIDDSGEEITPTHYMMLPPPPGDGGRG